MRKGSRCTEEHKRKVSMALRGRRLTPEHKRKLSEAHKGIHHTEETKRKLRAANTGERNPRYGKHHTEEAKRKIGEAARGRASGMTGKHHSEETKRKLSEAGKGRHHTDETKEKIAASHRGMHRTDEARRKMREASKRRWANEQARRNVGEAIKRSWANGAYENANFNPPGVTYKGVQMRSLWESRLAQIFDRLGWDWEYEPRRFQYILAGSRHTYTPDFYVPHLACYFDPHDSHWTRDEGKFNAIREQCGIALVVIDECLLRMYERLRERI